MSATPILLQDVNLPQNLRLQAWLANGAVQFEIRDASGKEQIARVAPGEAQALLDMVAASKAA